MVHVDGSALLQTVESTDEPLWGLLEEFRKRTGVPMVVNTSLNRRTAIVQSTRDALALLATSPLDALVVILGQSDTP